MEGYGLETPLSRDFLCIEFILLVSEYIRVSDSHIDARTWSLSIVRCMYSIAT